MKKVDKIRLWLDQGVSPKDIAREVPCALSLVYSVRGRREMARLNHEMALIQQELMEIRDRLCRLEGKPVDILRRMLAQNRDR